MKNLLSVLFVLLCGSAAASPFWFATFIPAVTFQTPTFIQGGSSFCNTYTYAQAQNAGDTNIVAIGNNANGSLATITDTKGNTYTQANAPLTTGTEVQTVYYASNIAAAAASANTITITWSGGTPTGCDLRATEYSGVGTLDTVAANTGSGTALDSGAASTTQTVDLLIGSAYVQNAVTAPGSGYVQRVLSGGSNAMEDQVTSTVGSYDATATQAPTGSWIMQLTAFRAAPGTPTGGGTQSLLTYLNSLRNSGKMLSGQYSDHFAGAGGGSYGNALDVFTGSTPATATISSCTSSSSCTNTGLMTAIMGVFLNSPGTCGSALTQTQGINLANGQLAAGGIVLVTFAEPSPTQSGCNFPGNGTEFPAVLQNGSEVCTTNACNVYFYGQSSGPGYGGGTTTCTKASPCGGVWGQAQALKQVNGPVIFRLNAEGNLGGGGNWYSTAGTGTGGGGANNAAYVSLYKQTIDYMRSLGVNNVVLAYCFNAFSNAYSNNDPGSSYRDIICGDMYGSTTQASVINNLNNASSGFGYAQGLGIPVLMCEAGGVSALVGSVSQFSYDSSIFDQLLQQSSSITNLVGDVIWNQPWALQRQLNALKYMQNTIARSQLPVIAGNAVVPVPASLVGYNVKTFDSTRVPTSTSDTTGPWFSYNMLGNTNTAVQASQNSDGTLSITYSPATQGDSYGGGLASVYQNNSAPNKWSGVAFGGGAYFEMQAAIANPTVNTFADGGPAFWTDDIEWLSGGSTSSYDIQWPCTGSVCTSNAWNSGTTYAANALVTQNGHWWLSNAAGNLNHSPPSVGTYSNTWWTAYQQHVEWDFMEYDVGYFSGTAYYQNGIGDWTINNASTSNQHQSVGGSAGSVPVIPSNADLTQLHYYGTLWIPATGASAGQLQFYFDRQLTATGTYQWGQWNPASPPAAVAAPWTGGTNSNCISCVASSIADQRHFALLLGGDNNHLMKVASVQVWQANALSNVMQ